MTSGIRNRAPGTIRAYIRSVAQFAEFFGKSPDVLGWEHRRRPPIATPGTTAPDESCF